MKFSGIFGLACGAALLASTTAFALPKAAEIYPKMGLGWNLGNTMEAPAGPTTWGNPFPTEELIDSVKAAGFTTVRIPTAWYSHSNAAALDSNWTTKPVPDGDDYAISAGWMDSVKMVVDWCIKKDLYVILNIHYDWGWLEQHIGTAVDETVNARQKNFWKQIATKFADYDEHLLFASANEPGMNQPGANNGETFKQNDAYTKTLKAYHQTMIDEVRATGGNNATRTIIVQGMNTDENLAHTQFKDNLPTDPSGAGYMMGEFHFYPYQFSLMENDDTWGNCFYYWGEGNYSTTDVEHNATYNKSLKKTVGEQYAGPAYLDSVFAMLKNDFDMPMIVGEFGAIKRLKLTGENLRLHLQSRAAFYGKVAEASKKNGFVPVVWDTGAEDNYNMTIIRRQKGKKGIMDYESLNAMRRAYGLDTLAGNSIDSLVKESLSTDNRALEVTYTSARSDTNETGTMRINVGGADWSQYKAISFVMKIDVKDGPLDGKEYGWHTVSIFEMSTANWVWSDVNIDNADIANTWAEYKVSLGPDGLDFNKKNDKGAVGSIKNVQAVGLNLYGTTLSGTIAFDEVRLYKADGTYDVLESFNKQLPDIEGIADGKLVSTPAEAASTKEVTGIASVRATAVSKMLVNVQNGVVSASFTAAKAAPAKAVLLNSMGQVIAQESFMANKGMNSVELRNSYRGPAMLMVKQGSQRYVQKVILK